MIQYTCAQCGMLLETEPAMVGKEERCPGCGRVNTVPAETVPAHEPPQAAPAYDLPEPAASVVMNYAPPPSPYAGFWRRLAAIFLDGLIIGAVAAALGLPVVAPAGVGRVSIEPLGIVLAWLYFALMESSAKQATLGKMALGIIVTDEQGRRISFARATGRHFAKILSALTLLIGYLMAGFTRRKQALHDMLAGCLVLKKGEHVVTGQAYD